MAKHTTGKVHLTDDGRLDSVYAPHVDGICAPILHGFADPDCRAEQLENMRRLAACWNALAGVDTDFIERVPQSPGFTIMQLQAKRIEDLERNLKELSHAS